MSTGETLPATTRRRHAEKLFNRLGSEVVKNAPAGIWDWPELGELVDPNDRALQRAATAYVQGRCSRDELIAAAEALRSSWREAVQRYSAESAPARAA